ncbi:iron-molybdenum cofactor-binding protein [Caminibacter mediatlanticus TB-2]|uniref:Iron-molybdenum cofactor-binding protein n=1 Tax=Caminibacter mediatlanticus TB-2 TaxID=391592 RepID=A0ABX5VB58_9BACT|nr:NifB/NifX family molybdenum-iron cluster-binding protein [Caminibacter mediatlanticus]QCT94642.1 iron-molybdenum cofactor-binding protein [Caminibacter mediatlanticus TB-2]
MRVAFPTNNQTRVARHIGLAKGFLIIDTDTNEKFFIENPVLESLDNRVSNEEGNRGLGTGRIVPILLKEAGVDVFVANEFSDSMRLNLQREKIIPFVTDIKDIEEALEYVLKNSSESKNYTIDNEESIKCFGYRRGFGKGYGFKRGGSFGRRGCGFGMGHGRENRRGEF